MAPKKRLAVKHEDEDESQKSRRISNHEEETGGDTHVTSVVVLSQGSTNLAILQVKSLLDPSAAEKRIDDLLALRLSKEENSGARDDFESTDICKNLVVAMEQQNANNNSASFLQKCCQLIVIFTVNVNHFKTGFLLAGAVKAICISMTKSPYHKDLQANACLALCNLSNIASQSEAKKMIDDGAIDTIRSAMKCHPESKNIQKPACAFLYYIIIAHHWHPTCAIDLMEKGCIESVLKAMEAHLADKEIQMWACDFLTQLSEANPDALNRIEEKGGDSTLVKVKNIYRGKDAVIDAIIEHRAKQLLRMIYK
jgi:hypothetical protein